MKPARSDPVRRKAFDRIQPRSCRIPCDRIQTGRSDGNPNKIPPNPIAFHRILSNSDDIRTGIRPSNRTSWDPSLDFCFQVPSIFWYFSPGSGQTSRTRIYQKKYRVGFDITVAATRQKLHQEKSFL